MESAQTVQAVIREIDDRTPSVRIIRCTPDAPFAFQAGQYVNLSSHGHESRHFSLAEAPRHDGLITLHIRNSGQGLSAHLVGLKVGDTLGVSGPFGSMLSGHAVGRPVLMVAGGTGIAPMLSIASDILRHGLSEEGITIVYGARSTDDIYCRPELDALMSTGEVTVHEALGDDTPDRLLARLGQNYAHHVVYLSGPHAMITPVLDILRIHMADDARIYSDALKKDKQ